MSANSFIPDNDHQHQLHRHIAGGFACSRIDCPCIEELAGLSGSSFLQICGCVTQHDPRNVGGAPLLLVPGRSSTTQALQPSSSSASEAV